MKDYSQYEIYFRGTQFLGSNRINDPRFYLLKHMYEEYYKRYSVELDYFQFDYMINAIEKLYGEFFNRSVAVMDNPGLYDLLENLDKPYDPDVWDRIVRDNDVQKLSQKRKYHIRTKKGDLTFAGYLLDQEGLET